MISFFRITIVFLFCFVIENAYAQNCNPISARKLTANDFPFTNSNGLTISTNASTSYYDGQSDDCNGNNTFITANGNHYWLQYSYNTLTYNFSRPVRSFYIAILGVDNGEILTVTSNEGSISFSDFCSGFTATNNQLRCVAAQKSATYVKVTSSRPATRFTFINNGVGNGTVFTLLDCATEACWGLNTTSIAVCETDLPYNWRGQIINNLGSVILRDTVLKSTDCDSIYVANITVRPIKRLSINKIICAQNLPFTWNGQTINAVGDFTLRDTTASLLTGCDSITTLLLKVNPTITATFTRTICQTALPFTWNGQTINTVGDFTLRDTTASLLTGCDSITTLLLKVNPSITATFTQTICQTALPFTWNGQTINAVGNFNLRDTTASLLTSCDSISILSLIVTPTITASITQTICEQALPFTWNGQTVTTAGNFTLIDTTASLVTGCDSITTLTLEINPTKRHSLTQIICEQALPFTWNGQTVTTAGNFTLRDTSASLVTGCDSISILSLTVNPTIITTLDYSICQANLPFVWNGQTVNTVGDFILRDTTASLVSGCDSISILNLVVFPSPIVDLGMDINSCELSNWNKVLDATLAGAKSYLWNTNAITSSINVVHNGVYFVAVTDSFGCIGYDTIAVETRLSPKVELPADTNICASDTIIIDGYTKDVNNYIWNTGAHTPTISAVLAGVYKLTVVGSNGCISSDSMTIFTHDYPFVDLGSDFSKCVDMGTKEFLNAGNPGANYLWDNKYNGQVRVIDKSGKYWVAVTNNWGCTTNDTIAVVIKTNPIVNLPTDTIVCKNATVMLDAGNDGIQYFWNTGAITSKITTSMEGVHVVVVTGDNGCVVRDSVMIIQNGLFPSHDGIWVRNRGSHTFEFSLIKSNSITNYAWDFGDGSPLDYSANPVHTYSNVGNYIVRLRLNSECGYINDTTTVHIMTQGTSIDNYSNLQIKAYPNPTQHQVFVESDIPVSLHLHSIDGRFMKSVEKAKQIDMKEEIQGMYLLHVKDLEGNLLKVFKIIKE